MKRNITYSSYTDKGSREMNEDAIGYKVIGDRCCFLLCDGLGGHGMGEVASSLAIKAFECQFEEYDNPSEFLMNAFQAAQDIITAEQKAQHAINKMKTTAVIVSINNDRIHFGHIGDSRVYMFRRNRVVKRTVDHSVPQMLALSGEIKETEIRNHPNRNILLRVLGVEWNEPMYVISEPIPIRKIDAFLLCSDGFWELIDESDMCTMLKESNSVTEWMSRMRSLVESNGQGINMDNNSAIAVWIK